MDRIKKFDLIKKLAHVVTILTALFYYHIILLVHLIQKARKGVRNRK